MIRMENHLGTIEISESYFSSLVGNAASSCFGVVGMANSNARQGIRSFFNRRRSFPDQGVAVRKEGDGLAIDLHIIVTYGLNISIGGLIHEKTLFRNFYELFRLRHDNFLGCSRDRPRLLFH